MSRRNSTGSATQGKSGQRPKPATATAADTRSGTRKAERPEGSPLFMHATGRWAKKIRGKLHYFGRGPHDDALAEYEKQKADLHAGRKHRDEEETLTVYMLCAKFLICKKQLRDSGELSPHTYRDYGEVCQLLVKMLGRNRAVSDLRPDDFQAARARMSKKWGLVRVGNTINKIRIVFNYAYKNGLINRPMVYGEGFRRPSRKAIRKQRREKGPRMFEAHEIRAIVDGALVVGAEGPELVQSGAALRAMILLGVNGGLGNADVGNLPLSALDLEKGWIDFPRPKTEIDRRIPLWPETVQALRHWLTVRPEAKDSAAAGLVFVTKYGQSWAKEIADSPVSKETAKLLKAIGINGHRNFYALRHTFQTIGDDSGDFLAVRHIMGHATNDIADQYRERISDERLRKVTDHVRKWLFGSAASSLQ